MAESETISSGETEQRAELQTQAAGDADNSQSVTQSVSAAGDVSEIAENAMPSIVAITNKGVEEVQSMLFWNNTVSGNRKCRFRCDHCQDR